MEITKNSSKNTKKILIQIVLFLGLVVAILFGWNYFKNNLQTVMKVPNFELINQNNQKITNRDMLAKVYLVEFFFARCPTICPVMNRNLKYVDQEIHDPNFGIISISIDPKNDTPEFLKEHAKKMGVTNPNWHFLTGNRDYIGKIADEFDIYVGKNVSEAESLNHSGMIALVDKKGNVRCRINEKGTPILYYSGLNYEDEAGTKPKLDGKFQPDRKLLIEDIRKLLEE